MCCSSLCPTQADEHTQDYFLEKAAQLADRAKRGELVRGQILILNLQRNSLGRNCKSLKKTVTFIYNINWKRGEIFIVAAGTWPFLKNAFTSQFSV